MILFKTKVEYRGGTVIFGHSDNNSLLHAIKEFIPEVANVSARESINLSSYLRYCVPLLLKTRRVELVNLIITAREAEAAVTVVYDDNNEFIEEVYAPAKWFLEIEIKENNDNV